MDAHRTKMIEYALSLQFNRLTWILHSFNHKNNDHGFTVVSAHSAQMYELEPKISNTERQGLGLDKD